MKMEVVEVSSGIYALQFNGSVITNCFHDTDCPGQAQVCALNETWSAFPAMCTCDVSLGYEGLGCDVTGSFTRFVLGTMITAAIIVAITLVVSIVCLVLAFRTQTTAEKKKVTSITITLAFATLSAATFLPALVLLLYNAIEFPVHFRLVTGIDYRFPDRPDRIVRLQEYGDIHPTMLIFGFIFTTLTMFFLAGVWSSVAVSYQTLTPVQGKMIERACVAYLVFSILVLVPTTIITTLWVVSSVILFLVVVFLFFCFLVTGYRMGKVVRALASTSSESTNQRPTSKSNSAGVASKATIGTTSISWAKMHRILREIHHTALVLAALCLSAAVSFGVYGIGPARRPTLYPPIMSKRGREFAYRFAILAVVLCNAVVVAYLFRTLRSRHREQYRNKQRVEQAEQPNALMPSTLQSENPAVEAVPAEAKPEEKHEGEAVVEKDPSTPLNQVSS